MASEAAIGLKPLQFARFAPYRRVRHGITGRAAALWREGDTSYSTGGDPEQVFANRQAWGASIGIDAAKDVAVDRKEKRDKKREEAAPASV